MFVVGAIHEASRTPAWLGPAKRSTPLSARPIARSHRTDAKRPPALRQLFGMRRLHPRSEECAARAGNGQERQSLADRTGIPGESHALSRASRVDYTCVGESE